MKGALETPLRNQPPSPEVKEIPIYPKKKNQIYIFLFHTINSTKLRKWQNVAWLFFRETENSGCMDGNKSLFFGIRE